MVDRSVFRTACNLIKKTNCLSNAIPEIYRCAILLVADHDRYKRLSESRGSIPGGMKFEVLTAGFNHKDGGSKFLQNVGNHLQD
jgi:hypothetical protein